MVLDIVMPFYGRFDHFEIAVKSVLQQSSGDWRLIIVDDQYPDEVPALWAQSIDDHRVSYVRNETNLGVSGNFRKCADLMTSEFGVVMGCDDVIRPRFVERVHELLQEFPSASIVQPGVDVIDSSGAPSRPLADRVKAVYRGRVSGPATRSGEHLATSLIRGNWAYFPSVVWRVSEIQRIGFRQDLHVVQDLAMLLEITLNGGELIVDDEVVFDYRRHSESVSAIAGPDGSKFVEERTLLSEVAVKLDELGWHRAARAARRYWSSRLHALTDYPAALRKSSKASRRILTRHILGMAYPAAAQDREENSGQRLV